MFFLCFVILLKFTYHAQEKCPEGLIQFHCFSLSSVFPVVLRSSLIAKINIFSIWTHQPLKILFAKLNNVPG